LALPTLPMQCPPGMKFSLVFLFIGGRARDDFAQRQMGMSCLDEGRQKHFRLQHTRAAPRTTFGEYVRTKRSTASQKETRRQRPAAIRQHPAGTTALRGGRNTYGSKFDPYRMDHYGLTLLHFAAQLIVQQWYWPPLDCTIGCQDPERRPWPRQLGETHPRTVLARFGGSSPI
jgi:hypothetical protein